MKGVLNIEVEKWKGKEFGFGKEFELDFDAGEVGKWRRL